MLGPHRRPRREEPAADAFAFGAGNPVAQATRNLLVVAMLPWAAACALAAELVACLLGRRED